MPSLMPVMPSWTWITAPAVDADASMTAATAASTNERLRVCFITPPPIVIRRSRFYACLVHRRRNHPPTQARCAGMHRDLAFRRHNLRRTVGGDCAQAVVLSDPVVTHSRRDADDLAVAHDACLLLAQEERRPAVLDCNHLLDRVDVWSLCLAWCSVDQHDADACPV